MLLLDSNWLAGGNMLVPTNQLRAACFSLISYLHSRLEKITNVMDYVVAAFTRKIIS